MKKVLVSLLALFLVCGCGSAEKEKEELNVAKTLDEVKEMIKEESSMPLVIEKELLQSSDLEKLRNYTKDQVFYVKGDFDKEELMESPYKMKSNFDMTDQSIQMVGVYMQGKRL